MSLLFPSELYALSVLGAYPHTDTNCHLAVNVSLTPQSSVKTGFWSANAKPSILDFTHDDYNALDRCISQLSQHHEQETHHLGVDATWFQVNDTDNFTLQDLVEIGLNEALLSRQQPPVQQRTQLQQRNLQSSQERMR